MPNKKFIWSIGLAAFIIVVAVSLTGCLEQIDLEIPKGFEETIVIQGQLVRGENDAVVDIVVTRLFDFTPESLVERVNVKAVNIVDDQGQSLPLEVVETGVYRLVLNDQTPIRVEEGKAFQINVSTFDGRTFESTFETVPAVVRPLKIASRVTEKSFVENETEEKVDSFIEFSLSTNLLAEGTTEPSFLHWKIFRSYEITDSPLLSIDPVKTCYVTETADITDVKLFDGNSVPNAILDDYTVYESKVDHRLSQGYYIQVIQESISNGAFNYLDQVRQSIDRDGSIFQSPAGKLSTNFVNVEDPADEVFGYFYATSQDTIRLFIDPATAGSPSRLCPPNVPPPPGGGCPILVCCDCLSVENSSTQKPSFWEK